MRYIKNITLTMSTLMFMVSLLLSQKLPREPYSPVKFKDLNYKWYERSVDSTMISPYCDGGNLFASEGQVEVSILDEEYIYSIYTIIVNDTEGAYVEKRNIETGKKEWSNRFDLSNNDRQEVAKLFFLDKDKNVVVVTGRLTTPYNPNIINELLWGHQNLRLAYRKYDNKTGEEIERNIFPENSPVITNGSRIQLFASRVFRISDTTFLYFQKDQQFPTQKLKTVIIDHKGNMIGKENIIETNLFDIYLNVDYRNDTVYMHQKDTVGGDKNYLIKYTKELKEVGRIKLEVPQNVNLLCLSIKWTNDYFILLDDKQGSLPFYRKYKMYIFNYAGKLLKYIDLPEDITTSFLYEYNMEKNETNFLASRQTFTFPSPIELITYKEKNGKLEVVKKFEILDGTKGFFPRNIYKIDNDDYILNFGETKYYDVNGRVEHDIFARARTYMRQSKYDLHFDEKSDVVDEKVDNQVKIYPNPTNAEITVEMSNKVRQSIEIVNILSQKVMQETIEGRIDLEISQLEKGLYMVRIGNKVVGRFLKI